MSIKILIADDHAVVAEGLKHLIEAQPELEVIGIVPDGREAVRLAKETQPDVVLMDLSMPELNGADATRAILERDPKCRVIVLSMYAEREYVRRALKAGAAGYVSKETAGEELTAAVKKVATGGRYVSAALAEKLASRLMPEQERPPHERLSDREYRVMWMLASGKTLQEIADEMKLSPSTVSTYRGRILKKLNLHTNVDLVHYAMKHKLIE